MRLFIRWATSANSITDIATTEAVSRWTLHRRWHWCWHIIPPDPVDPHRIYDQLFLDATFVNAGCLLIASTKTHVVNWCWARRETTAAYSELIESIAPPLMVIIDGGQGAWSAIKKHWPTTTIQRCLVHAQRVVRRYTTSRPKTVPGKAIYAIALNLTRVRTTDHAVNWIVALHDFGQTYRQWMDQTTTSRDPLTGRTITVYTHQRVRNAYASLLSLQRRSLLFNFLAPPDHALTPHEFCSNTNPLEGGINATVKEINRRHKGLTPPHQRTVLDWWLYLKTQAPDDPVDIARSQHWGHDALSTAQSLLTHENTNRQQAEGAPSGYDTGIDTNYQHSMGVQKGWAGH